MANQSSDFEKWMRTGRTEEGRTPSVEVKFNPNHDPKNGRFTFAGQGGQSAEGTHVTRTRRSPVHPTPRKQSSGERAAIAQHPERETAAANELRVRRAANLAQAQKDLADPKVQALVDLIANRETGGRFDTIVGGSKFSNFSRHPNVYVKKYNSTAAGAYQFNAGTWNDVSSALGLTDFSPQSQRYGAVYLLKHLGAIKKLQDGDIPGAILAAGKRWDSLPRYRDGRSLTGKKHPLKALVNAYGSSLPHYQRTVK